MLARQIQMFWVIAEKIETQVFFFFLIEVELTYSVVSVSGVQQSDSVIHTHMSILFQILFPSR